MKSKTKKILASLAVGLALTTSTAAVAADRDRDGRQDNSYAERHDGDGYRDVRDRDRDGRPDNSWAERHDRDGYNDNNRYDHRMNRHDNRQARRMIGRERFYDIVRSHHYRYIGEPYWYRGVYGVKAYDRRGHVVFVRVDPYEGTWGGVFFRF